MDQSRLAILLNTKESILSFRQPETVFFVSVACVINIRHIQHPKCPHTMQFRKVHYSEKTVALKVEVLYC